MVDFSLKLCLDLPTKSNCLEEHGSVSCSQRRSSVDELFGFLGAWWYWGCDGRTKSADAADTYVLPVLLLIGLGCLVALITLT